MDARWIVLTEPARGQVHGTGRELPSFRFGLSSDGSKRQQNGSTSITSSHTHRLRSASLASRH